MKVVNSKKISKAVMYFAILYNIYLKMYGKRHVLLGINNTNYIIRYIISNKYILNCLKKRNQIFNFFIHTINCLNKTYIDGVKFIVLFVSNSVLNMNGMILDSISNKCFEFIKLQILGTYFSNQLSNSKSIIPVCLYSLKRLQKVIVASTMTKSSKELHSYLEKLLYRKNDKHRQFKIILPNFIDIYMFKSPRLTYFRGLIKKSYIKSLIKHIRKPRIIELSRFKKLLYYKRINYSPFNKYPLIANKEYAGYKNISKLLLFLKKNNIKCFLEKDNCTDIVNYFINKFKMVLISVNNEFEYLELISFFGINSTENNSIVECPSIGTCKRIFSIVSNTRVYNFFENYKEIFPKYSIIFFNGSHSCIHLKELIIKILSIIKLTLKCPEFIYGSANIERMCCLKILISIIKKQKNQIVFFTFSDIFAKIVAILNTRKKGNKCLKEHIYNWLKYEICYFSILDSLFNRWVSLKHSLSLFILLINSI
mmetsp:Transcript_26461/g.41884  ORF Transcript_26461/g.41884 Transcript_26461/m.41884 type:complete len:481 (-) Transcript_26461:5809-7251(-)